MSKDKSKNTMHEEETIAKYTAISETLHPLVSQDGEAHIHIDAGAGYGLGVKTMKQHDWVSVGGEIDKKKVAKAKELYGDGTEVAESDIRKDSFWKGFSVVQACDLLTCLNNLLEKLTDKELTKVIDLMASSARWGVFEVSSKRQSEFASLFTHVGADIYYSPMQILRERGFNLLVVKFKNVYDGESEDAKRE